MSKRTAAWDWVLQIFPQRSEAGVEGGSALLLRLDLDGVHRGRSRLSSHRLLQLVDADLHRRVPLLACALLATPFSMRLHR